MELGVGRILNQAFAEKGLHNVIKWDVQNIEDGQEIKVEFISKGSPHRQGVWLRTDNGIVIPSLSNEKYPSISLWEDSAPKELICRCYTSNGYLSIYNIWDRGNGRQSQSYSSGIYLKNEITF
ncbi:hypothetical protein [Robertmurraya korlensis]|uniref:hypothetical protein n=1 Tax=Robertmurraya korlensis TaxID=519977 RepID=UPI00082669CE|nr:hypothetical protein [Robertmurraya korlensis]